MAAPEFEPKGSGGLYAIGYRPRRGHRPVDSGTGKRYVHERVPLSV